MTFEHSDEPLGGVFNVSPVTQPVADMPASEFGVPYFLPTNSPDVPEQLSDTPAPRSSYADPWRMKQINFIGGKAYEGEHRSMLGQAAADRYKRKTVVEHAVLMDFLDRTAHQNDRYAGELETIQQVLAADFGHLVAGTRFITLDKTTYKNFFKDGSVACCESDVAILGIDHADVERYGPNYLLRQGLHEGAHMASMYESAIVTFEQPASTDSAYVPASRHGADVMSMGDLVRPIVDSTGRLSMGGEFLDEGFIDSYAIRRVAQHGQPLPSGLDVTHVENKTALLGYARESSGAPYVDTTNDTLYLPYRYAAGAGVMHDPDRPEGKTVIHSIATGMAALSIDLMDARSPGLFQAMMDCMRNPDAQQQVADHINGIQPGLHEDLLQADYTISGMRYGALRVLGALGLTDAPVGTLH